MNAVVQSFHFQPGTLIAYDGFQVVVVGAVKGGVTVRDRFVGRDEKTQYMVITDEKIHELLARLDVEIDQDFCADDPSIAETMVGHYAQVSFEKRSAKDKRTAYQREAWCLAAWAVLKGEPASYTEKQIQDKYEEIKARATDRQRLNELGSSTKNGEFKARGWGAKSVSNYCKIYFKVPEAKRHPRLLINKTSVDKGRMQMSLASSELLDQCCRAYLNTAQPSKTSIYKLAKKKFAEAQKQSAQNGRNQDFRMPHKNTVFRRLKKFSKLQLVIGREGYQAAQKEFSPTQHGVRVLKPGEMIELDFWQGDVFTFSKQSKFWGILTPDVQKLLKDGKRRGKKKQRQRLWICIAVDVATRVVLGAGMAEKPNSATVIDVLDQIMRDKTDIGRLAGCTSVWSQRCGIGTIIVDTGPEFFNDEVQEAILAAGGSFIFGRAGVPMDKPFVERFFGGLRTTLADELPGKTGYSHTCLAAYDKEGMAVFNAEEFRHLLIRHLVDHYHLEVHDGLLGKRPIDAWRDAQKYRAVPPPPLRVRRNATGLKLTRMLTKEGVRICGIPFGDASLFPKHISQGKRLVEVRLDPNDLREISIKIDGQTVHLENQRKDLAHHTMRTLMAAIKEMTATNPKDRKFYEYVLAKHANWQSEKIRVGIEKHGLPSTDITVEKINWFETTHCLRLQIMANPEKAMSADIDAVLEGKTGKGIFTPEDINREKTEAARLRAAGKCDDELQPGSVSTADTPAETANDMGASSGNNNRKAVGSSLKKVQPKCHVP